MKIWEKIKAVRESRGITQSYIAARIDMDKASYSRSERTGERIYYDTLEAVSKVLDMSVTELLDYGEPSGSNEAQLLKKELEEEREKNRELLASYIKLSNAFIDLQSQINK